MKQNRPIPRNITVKLQNTEDKEKILQAHRQKKNSNSQQRIRIQITLSFFKSNPGNYKTMEQCPHDYFQLKILFQDKLLSIMVDMLDLKT